MERENDIFRTFPAYPTASCVTRIHTSGRDKQKWTSSIFRTGALTDVSCYCSFNWLIPV